MPKIKHMASKSKGKGKAPKTSDYRAPNLEDIVEVEEAMEGMTKEERTLFDLIKKKKFERTRVPASAMVEALGFKNKLKEDLEAMGWWKFVMTNEMGYMELAREFLISLEINKKHLSPDKYYSFSFHLFGKKYSMSKAELDALFGFQTQGIEHHSSIDAHIKPFWLSISTETNIDKNSVAKHIKEPYHWLLHRIITYTINARGDGNEKISKKDLTFLYCIINKQPIQTSIFFLDHLYHVGHKASGVVLNTSHIAIIARYVKALPAPSHLKPLLATPLSVNPYGTEYLTHAKAFLLKEKKYVYQHGVEEEPSRKRQRVEGEEAREERREQEEEVPPPQPFIYEETTQTQGPSFGDNEARLRKIEETTNHNKARIEKIYKLLGHIHEDLILIQKKQGIKHCDLVDWESELEEDEEEDMEDFQRVDKTIASIIEPLQKTTTSTSPTTPKSPTPLSSPKET